MDARRGERRKTAELRTAHQADIELRLSHDSTLYYSQRHVSRQLALTEAERARRDLEQHGWMPAA